MREYWRSLPRHRFVPAKHAQQAYSDQPLPIMLGQTISQPYIVALMTEKLALEQSHRVLEIGTGCGYQTAILAQLVSKVHTIEVRAELAEQARRNLTELGICNVEHHLGDGSLGWPGDVEFDRILVTAAAADIPSALLRQLADGGKMVVPVGRRSDQELMLVEKKGQSVRKTLVCHCRFVRLVTTLQ